MEYLREDGRLFALVLEKFDADLGLFEPRTASEVVRPPLFDAHLIHRLAIRCVSTCNQSLTVQPVGHILQDRGGTFNIGGTSALASTAPVVTTFDLGGGVWQPYLGVTVTAGGAPPTAGQLQVSAHGEHWVKVPVDEQLRPIVTP